MQSAPRSRNVLINIAHIAETLLPPSSSISELFEQSRIVALSSSGTTASDDYQCRNGKRRHARIRCDDDEYYEQFKNVEDVTKDVLETKVGFLMFQPQAQGSC
jgi:hypothetical protein